MDIISRYHAPGDMICQYYGLGMMPSTGVQQIVGNAGQYDIFDGTRSLAPYSAQSGPPQDVNRKPVGTVPITVPRMYNKIGIMDNDLFGTRDLGQAYSQPVPSRGEAYFARQVRYLKTRMDNSHEFMAAHMFRGGWDLRPLSTGSQQLVLDDKTSGVTGAITNDTKVPAANMSQITAADGSGDIIATSWDDPTANIPEQNQKLQANAAQINGRRIEDVWLNGVTFSPLLTNSVLQGVGGSVYRIFDTMNPHTEYNAAQKMPDTGTTVVFRGMPEIKFHVYNQGYVTPGTSETQAAQTGANFTRFIPDNYAIMTPSPGEWTEMVQGSEVWQPNLLEGGPRVADGFDMGTERSIDPPKHDVKMLYNGAPVITEPSAVYYAEVIFTP